MQHVIYSYLNYREFLKDQVETQRQAGSFRVRDFAKRAGIKSPGYLKMVIEGRRNLGAQTTPKFARGFALEGDEANYFAAMVAYTQSTDPDIKSQYFEQLMRMRPRSADLSMDQRFKRYMSRPHYVCIREMVVLHDFREDHKWIAARCFPSISPSEAKDAISTLLEIGLLNRRADGTLEQTDGFVRTEDRNTQAIEAYHYHEAMLNKARHALTQLPQRERNYYALTIPMPKELFPEIIEEFYALRDRVIAKVEAAGEHYDEVYHCNFQLFPATKDRSDES